MGKYRIKHSYKDVIIIPMVAFIDSNTDFIFDSGIKEVITSDNITAIVTKYNIYNICQLEQDVKEIYNTDCWSFLKKWYNYDNGMDSMSMFKLYLKKIE